MNIFIVNMEIARILNYYCTGLTYNYIMNVGDIANWLLPGETYVSSVKSF